MNKKLDRKRQISYDLNCMWNLKNETSKQNKMKIALEIQRINAWLPEGSGYEGG